jgi:hypothetical protein
MCCAKVAIEMILDLTCLCVNRVYKTRGGGMMCAQVMF